MSFYMTRKQNRRIFGKMIKKVNGNTVRKTIDSTVLTIGKGLDPELYMEGKVSAVRISTEFNRTTETPDKIIIVPRKAGERNALDDFVDKHETIS